jgi:hypothetical protein
LVDECLPNSVASFFESQGYEVHIVGRLLPSGSPDANVVAAALDLGAIVVTTDHHFRPLKSSMHGYGGRLGRADRIYFTCEHPRVLARVKQLIDVIEREYQLARSSGQKFMIKITENSFTVYR